MNFSGVWVYSILSCYFLLWSNKIKLWSKTGHIFIMLVFALNIFISKMFFMSWAALSFALVQSLPYRPYCTCWDSCLYSS